MVNSILNLLRAVVPFDFAADTCHGCMRGAPVDVGIVDLLRIRNVHAGNARRGARGYDVVSEDHGVGGWRGVAASE